MVFVIAAVTALFVYLCVMIAVIKPAKTAAHVTPIEAVRYMAGNNDVMSNSTKVLHRSLSAKNLAFLNFARNRKENRFNDPVVRGMWNFADGKLCIF